MIRKIKKSVFTTQFYVYSSILLLTLLFSCSEDVTPEQVKNGTNEASFELDYNYSRDFTVFDTDSLNSVLLRVSANDISVLNEITPSNFILSVLFSEEDEEFNKTESPSPSLEEFSIDEALGFQILENHLEGGAIGIKLETDFGNDFRYKRKWYTHDVGISGGYRSYRVKRTAWFEGQIHVTERVRRTNNTTGATYGWGQEEYSFQNHPINCNGCSYYSDCFDAAYLFGWTVNDVFVYVHAKNQNKYAFYRFFNCN